MATYQDRKNGHITATVRRVGFKSMSRTFAEMHQAEEWARGIEAQIRNGGVVDYPELRKAVIHDLMGRYVSEVLAKRKGWRSDVARMEMMQREPWAKLDCSKDIAAALRARKRIRLAVVKGQSFNRELGLLVGFFDYAIKEWGLPLKVNPATMVLRAQETAPARKVVWSATQMQSALDVFGFSYDRAPDTLSSSVGWVMLLLRQTGLRIGTLCSIRVDDVHLEQRFIRFSGAQVKNGEDWDCPISDRAAYTLERLLLHRQGEARLLPAGSQSVGRLFRETLSALADSRPELQGLHIHGLRKTWTTEYAPKIPDAKLLLKITGRKNLKTLLDNYYQPDASELAGLLNN